MAKLSSLVTAAELHERLDDPDLVVLDATWSMTYEGPKSPRAGFERCRIPGARLFDHSRVRDEHSPLHDTVCSAEQFQDYVRSLGISEQHLVLYSQGLFSSAARAWWLFRLFGHRRVSLLHGGLKAWLERGHSTDSGSTADAPASGSFRAQIDERLLHTVPDMQQAVGGARQVVDARPPAVFSGEKDWFAGRDSPAAGHPGSLERARNLPSSAAVEGGKLKPVDELRRVATAAGIDPNEPTVTSCSLGVGASGAAFVMHLLGNDDVAVFDGSWEAWAAAGKAGERE
jgi:thiosulfate/3-mercaptopyruvate sulfurtransferase